VSTDKTAPDQGPDSSDVVEGPVGSARLKDPETSGPIGADLDALPPIDVDAGDTEPRGRSIEGGVARPERGLAGAD